MSRYHHASRLAAKHIHMTPEIDAIIDEIKTWLQQGLSDAGRCGTHASCYRLWDKMIPPKKFRFENTYTGQDCELMVILDNEKRLSGANAGVSHTVYDKDSIVGYPEDMPDIGWTLYLSIPSVTEFVPKGASEVSPRLTEYLRHEFAHMLDPKVQKPHSQDIFDATEFDAYSTQLMYELQGYIDKGFTDVSNVLEWLRTGDDNDTLPQLLISYWHGIRDDEPLARKFKQRVFSAISAHNVQ